MARTSDLFSVAGPLRQADLRGEVGGRGAGWASGTSSTRSAFGSGWRVFGLGGHGFLLGGTRHRLVEI